MFSIKQGDSEPPLQVILKDADGKVAIINVGDVVTFRMSPVSVGVGPTVNATATVNDGTLGDVQYDWPGGAPAAGLYRAEFHVARVNGDSVTFPGDGYIDVKIETALG